MIHWKPKTVVTIPDILQGVWVFFCNTGRKIEGLENATPGCLIHACVLVTAIFTSHSASSLFSKWFTWMEFFFARVNHIFIFRGFKYFVIEFLACELMTYYLRILGNIGKDLLATITQRPPTFPWVATRFINGPENPSLTSPLLFAPLVARATLSIGEQYQVPI